MTTYVVNFSGDGEIDPVIPGKQSISIPRNTVNSSAVSVPLTGQGTPLYGEIQQENFIHLLENFASKDAPLHPTVGQLWFDSVNDTLNVYKMDETWGPIGGIFVQDTPPVTTEGRLWYNTADEILYLRVDPNGAHASVQRYWDVWVQIWPTVTRFGYISEYNAAALRLNKVIGTPTTDGTDSDAAMNQWGWGETDTVVIYSNANTPTQFDNNSWLIFISRLMKATRHVHQILAPESNISQYGYIYDGRGANNATAELYSPSYTWAANDGDEGIFTASTRYSAMLAALDALENNRFTVNTLDAEWTDLNTTTCSSWNQMYTATFQFGTQASAKRFFNAGGQLRFSIAGTGDIATDGFVIDWKGCKIGENGTYLDDEATSIGYYDLTTTFQTLHGATVEVGNTTLLFEAKTSTTGGWTVDVRISLIELANVLGATGITASVRSSAGSIGGNPTINTPAIVLPAISTSVSTSPNMVYEPVITSLTNNATGQPLTMVFSSSPFNANNGGDSHEGSDWQIANDAGFTDIISVAVNSSSNKRSWTVSSLDPLQTYHVRVRYKGATFGYSAWSNVTTPIQFTTSGAATYAVTPNITSVDEGVDIVFTITTSNIPNGATVFWDIVGTGITSADFDGGDIVGTALINNNTATVVRTVKSDFVQEDSESFVFNVRTGSNAGTIVATSATITINDTSINANTAPVLSQSFRESVVYHHPTPVTLFTSGTVSDAQLDISPNNWDGAKLGIYAEVPSTFTALAPLVMSVENLSGINTNTVRYNGTYIGIWQTGISFAPLNNPATNTVDLLINFNSAATSSLVSETLKHIKYACSSQSVTDPSITITVKVYDGNTGGLQGTGGALVGTAVSAVNPASGTQLTNYCSGFTRTTVFADGAGSTYTTATPNSTSCGYVIRALGACVLQGPDQGGDVAVYFSPTGVLKQVALQPGATLTTPSLNVIDGEFFSMTDAWDGTVFVIRRVGSTNLITKHYSSGTPVPGWGGDVGAVSSVTAMVMSAKTGPSAIIVGGSIDPTAHAYVWRVNSTGVLIGSAINGGYGSAYTNRVIVQTNAKVTAIVEDTQSVLNTFLVCGVTQTGGAFIKRMWTGAESSHLFGVLDNTFGGGTGVFFGGYTPYSCGCTIQANGKILVYGMRDESNYQLRRLNIDGTPDLTFGTSGIVTFTYPTDVQFNQNSIVNVVEDPAPGKLYVHDRTGIVWRLSTTTGAVENRQIQFESASGQFAVSTGFGSSNAGQGTLLLVNSVPWIARET